MRQRYTLLLSLPIVTFLLTIVVSPLQGQVKSINLREMVRSAGPIFIGTVTETRGGLDANGDIVTYTTFRVDQPISGMAARTVTIKQYGGKANGLEMLLSHMRYFRQGERVLVMLYPESDLGFTSPIGLNQGVWNIGGDGRVQNVTAAALKGLESLLTRHNLTARATQSIPSQTFIAMINELRGGAR